MASRRTSWQPIGLIAILLLGLALRLVPWGHNRFLEDEALYASWGLKIATGADPLLDEEPVDKPPLHPYILGLSFLLSGPPLAAGIGAGHETAARLPSLLASLVGILLVYGLALSLHPSPTGTRQPEPSAVGWRENATEAGGRSGLARGAISAREASALLAALLLALSPFDLLFASTAFTDPLMTALVLGALLAAARGSLGIAGVLAGLAAATKQQGAFFLPLVIVIGALASSRPQRLDEGRTRPKPRRSRRDAVARIVGQRWLRFALGFAAVIAGALWWDLARVQRPGFLGQSLISYGGLAPAQPQALGERAVEWLRLVGSFWASPWLNGLLLVVLLVWLGGGLAGRWRGWSGVDVALVLFVGGFLLVHWLLGFQVWDRYLLGLVPLLALLAARALGALGTAIGPKLPRRAYGLGLAALLAILLAGPVLTAVRGELPVGGDHGAYDGIDQLAGYMRNQARPGSVLYHYWLGYHYRFYLYGAPLRLHWYPDLKDLVDDATVYRRELRYIAFPSWRDSDPAQKALAEVGIDLEPVLETIRRDGSVSLRLYQLVGP
jgi:hypothetical protein